MYTERINWIDWAKVIAIFLVALGHLLQPIGDEGRIHDFIYLFHMPFFFFISGYLFKVKEMRAGDVFKRIIHSLLVPYLLLNLICLPFLAPSWILSRHIPIDNLFYIATADGHGEAGPTWFLICLAWVWIIAWLLMKSSRRIQYAVLAACAVIAYLFPFHLYWRIDTALMVLPFFMIGYYLKGKISFGLKLSGVVFVLCLVATLALAAVMGDTNTYLREYGRYPLLYYPSAFIGIFMLIAFCSMLNGLGLRVIQVLSTGTILIMALHGVAVLYTKSVLKHLCGILFDDYILWQKMLLAVVVLALLYYPIIFVQQYFPILMGNRGKRGTKQ